MTSRCSRGLLVLLGSMVLVGCPEPVEPEPEAVLVVELRDPVAELDPTHPDEPARVDFDIRLELEGMAPDQTTIRATSVELEGVGGVVSDGLGVEFLDGTAVVEELEVPSVGRATAARVTALPNGAAATLCGGTVHVRVLLHSTHCDCETEAVVDVEPHCLLDNRAQDLLDLPRRPATDRPCETVSDVSSTSPVQRFGYDAEGRLEILDTYAGATFVERVVYRYDASGFLAEELSVNPNSATIAVRRTYTYGADGVLTRLERDGSTGAPDGTPDARTTYTLGVDRWDMMTTALDTGSTSVATLTFDLAARTFTTSEPGEAVTTYSHELAVSDPNVFVALPKLERIFALQLREGSRSGETMTWTWDGGALTSETHESSSASTTLTYGYDCR